MDKKSIIGIIGFGLVGQALQHGFAQTTDFRIYDKNPKLSENTFEESIKDGDFIFICVPTPMKKNTGEADVSIINDTLFEISHCQYMKDLKLDDKIIIIKSTIPPGTTELFRKRYSNLRIIHNPEFLTGRSFRLDFINQSRIILGGDIVDCKKVERLYRMRFLHTPIYITDATTAEMAKYTANTFFATKLSFFNEIYDICQKLDIRYYDVIKMTLSDGRIGNSHYEVPGHDSLRGYGGLCVLGSAELKTSAGHFRTIEEIYNLKNGKAKGTRILVNSCSSNFNKMDFKEILDVSRREIDEDVYEFETQNGKFTCTEDHLIPILRNGIKILVKAKEILITDKLISIDGNKCKICNRLYKNIGNHIHSHGLTTQEYYDKYIKISKEGKCLNPSCNKKTNFLNLSEGYSKYCSYKCSSNNPLNLEKNRERTKKLWSLDEYRTKTLNNLRCVTSTETHRLKLKKALKGINRGNKNPMKNLDTAKKVSNTRKRLFMENPTMKIELSKIVSKAWKDGKFNGVKTGRCKWFDYNHSNGITYKVQGTWELSFIKWLDTNNIKFECHKGRLPYILDKKSKNYYPDFFIYDWNSYVDVKCKYFYNENKYNSIKMCNPKINLKILFKEDLLSLGVEI